LGTGMWSSPNESVPYPNNIGQQTISAIELAIDFQATRFITSYTLRSRGTVGEWTPSAWTLKTNAGVQVDARDNIIWSASQSQTFSLGVQLQPNTYSDSVFIFRFTKVYRSAVNTAELWCGFSPTCYIYGMSL
jgi:hypothetical protein